jgi:hypothetical protein
MADGTTLYPGAGGDKIDTEDLGGRGKIQRVKLALGALDVDGNDISPTNPVPTFGKRGSKTLSTNAPTNSAAQILAANSSRIQAMICNNGTMTVYLGKDNTVTTSNGIPLGVGASLVDDATTDAWWGIVSTGTGDLRVLEIA